MQECSARFRQSSACRLGLLVLGMMLSAIGCGEDSKDMAVNSAQFASTTWFGNLTQAQRNSYILSSANYFITNQLGSDCNCKVWAREVVQNASSNQASLPATANNGWQWVLPDQDVLQINYIPYQYPIYATVPGNIVQMMLGSNPHTAIVTSNNLSTVCFAEANYYSCQSAYRCQSISSFISSAPNHMAYVITGH
ncbi:MAG: hypothetical protein V1661_00755 [bacterium]